MNSNPIYHGGITNLENVNIIQDLFDWEYMEILCEQTKRGLNIISPIGYSDPS